MAAATLSGLHSSKANRSECAAAAASPSERVIADDRGAAAVAYAKVGIRVFPVHTVDDAGRCSCGDPACEHPGKHPMADLAPNGCNSATADVAIVGRWWARRPLANIGIATGQQSRLWVLDLDGAPADAFMVRLENEHGQLPETWAAETGRGGLHIYFRWPYGLDIRNSAGKIAPGVDVRGAGGYVVAPPSRHASGLPYRWLDGARPGDVPLAYAPAWVLERVTASPPRGNHAPADDGAIPEGQRNDTLFSIALAMRRAAASEPAILAALTAENDTRCDPPLSSAEVERIAGSALRYAARSTPTIGGKVVLPSGAAVTVGGRNGR